jgi:hypothetical protein
MREFGHALHGCSRCLDPAAHAQSDGDPAPDPSAGHVGTTAGIGRIVIYYKASDEFGNAESREWDCGKVVACAGQEV